MIARLIHAQNPQPHEVKDNSVYNIIITISRYPHRLYIITTADYPASHGTGFAGAYSF